MLKTWTLQNFKSVADRSTLEMAPLTIFAGANSSGKSTILQSILLVTQTLGSDKIRQPIILNGHLLKLGTFEDIHSRNSSSREISIEFELGELSRIPTGWLVPEYTIPHYIQGPFGHARLNLLQERTRSIQCRFTFAPVGKGRAKEQSLQPALIEAGLRLSIEATYSGHISFHEEISIRRSPKGWRDHPSRKGDYGSNVKMSDVMSSHTPYIVENYTRMAAATKSTIAFASHFLPDQVYIPYNSQEEAAQQLLLAAPPLCPDDELETVLEQGPALDTVIYGEALASLLQVLRECAEYLTSDKRSAEVRAVLESHTQSRFSISLSEVARAIQKRDNSVSEFMTGSAKGLSLGQELRNLQHSRLTGDSVDQGIPISEVWSDYRYIALDIRKMLAKMLNEKAETLRGTPQVRNDQGHPVEYQTLSPLLRFASDVVHMFFKNSVKYLGPLRDEPRALYPLSSASNYTTYSSIYADVDVGDVGLRGENTAAVFEAARRYEVTYIEGSDFLAHGPEAIPVERMLPLAVASWLQYLGIAEGIATKDRGKLGYELKVMPNEREPLYDLTHVGVGVSQVLPILVMSLLAREGTILVFEQPELHLHPRVQTRLADFFLTMTMLGKQVIVETHSEYIINRLRYHAVQPWGQAVADSTLIYFVEKEAGQSHFRPIRINNYGVIEDWPKGFFDESEEISSAILKAVMLKRKGQANNPNA